MVSERRRVLHVEDDEDIRDAVRMILGESGYDVTSAHDGAHALRLLASMARPCIIVLDLMMPILDGWTFLDEIRHLPDVADVPVVVTSACEAPRLDPRIAVVPKPFEAETLVEAVGRYC